MISDENGNCRPIISYDPICKSDRDCLESERCTGGNCVTICHNLEKCGINAQCLPNNHQAICSCPPGYQGNAYIECRHIQPPRPVDECFSDDECSYDKICSNKKCINPCDQNRNSCGRGAFCYVERKYHSFFFFLNNNIIL